MSSPSTGKIGRHIQTMAHLLPAPSKPYSHLSWRGQHSAKHSQTKHIESSVQVFMDTFFVAALVRAGTCEKHGETIYLPTIPTTRTYLFHRARRRPLKSLSDRTRLLHNQTKTRSQSRALTSHATQEDYKAMLDYYGEGYYANAPALQNSEPPKPPPLEPFGRNWISDDRIEDDAQKVAQTNEENQAIQHAISMIKDETTSNEALYESYKTIPYPGVRFLSGDMRRRLLQRLSVIEKKTTRTTFLYLSVVEDMKVAGLPLGVAEWNSAVYLTGRCFARVSAVEVEAALRTWKDMEEEAGVSACHVTFNILFDIAVKAGKYVLAEMIMKEMETRKLPLNRYGHVGLIYYYGMKGDGEGVRKAYREMVEAGEIIDTVVLNCVIASLLRAGEGPAAEQVYERMKQMHAKRTGLKAPNLDWRARRDLGRTLQRAADLYRDNALARQKYQDEQSLSPDVRTYVILLEHHVSQTGELHHVATLLDEMQTIGLPINSRFFMELFRGFSIHGGVRYTSWTIGRLESVWSSFTLLLDEDLPDVYISKWTVIWILRAFGKCCGNDRTLEIWEELKSRWKADDRDFQIASLVLDRVTGISATSVAAHDGVYT